MAIYTKRGDKGMTSLYDDKNRQNIRVSKSSSKIKAIGAVDEVNSYLGICVTHSKDNKTKKYLISIQKDLFTIGSILAGSKLSFSSAKTKKFERKIDELEGILPPLKNFILPGGTKLSSHLQYARSLTRRAERSVVGLTKKETVKPQVLIYLNRLSDFLFMLSREENHKKKIKEEVWVGNKKR